MGNKSKDNKIKLNAIQSLKWSTLTEIAVRLLPPLVTIILARILAPDEFGLVAVATIVIGFAQIFQDFGLGKTLIQRETRIEETANVVFWTNLSFGILIYIIIFILSPYIANFFGDPRATDVLKVLCLQIVLTSLTVVHLALLQREFKFRKLFLIRLVPSLLPGLISIPLALMGMGVWALVYGTLLGAVTQVIMYWKLSHWSPKLEFNLELARSVYSFSVWVLLEMILSWLIVWGDSMMLGHFLGIKELGIYTLGFSILGLLFGLVFNPIIPVAYSSFSRLQSNLEEFNNSFISSVKLLAVLSLPLGVLLLFLGGPISNVFFGAKWQGLGIVLSIIGLRLGMDYLVVINPEVYRAFGRPDANVKLLAANVIYYIPVYVIAAPYGLFIFCLARFGVAAFSLILHFFVANKLLKVPFSYITCVKSPFIASILLGVILYVIISLICPFEGFLGLIKLIIILGIGLSSYILILKLIDKELINSIFILTKKALNMN